MSIENLAVLSLSGFAVLQILNGMLFAKVGILFDVTNLENGETKLQNYFSCLLIC